MTAEFVENSLPGLTSLLVAAMADRSSSTGAPDESTQLHMGSDGQDSSPTCHRCRVWCRHTSSLRLALLGTAGALLIALAVGIVVWEERATSAAASDTAYDQIFAQRLNYKGFDTANWPVTPMTDVGQLALVSVTPNYVEAIWAVSSTGVFAWNATNFEPVSIATAWPVVVNSATRVASTPSGDVVVATAQGLGWLRCSSTLSCAAVSSRS